MSFSIYLWHWPVVLFLDSRWPGLGDSWRIPLLISVTGMLSATSYVIIERPFSKLRWDTQEAKERVTHTLVASLTIVVAASSGYMLFVWPPDPPINSSFSATYLDDTEDPKPGEEPQTVVTRWEQIVANSADLTTLPKRLSPPLTNVPDDHESIDCLNITENNLADCRWGSESAPKRVAVLGDSHALMWLTALRTVFEPEKFQIQSLGFGRCTNSDITRRETNLPTLGATCDAHRKWVWDKVKEMQPDILVLSDFAGFVDWTDDQGKARTDATQENWAAGLKRSLAVLAPNTKEVVILGQTPRGQSLASCLPQDLALDDCYGDDAYMSQQRVIEKDLVTAVKGTFVDVGPWLCAGDSCPPVIDNRVAFFDDNHLTVTMNKTLAPLLKYELRQLL